MKLSLRNLALGAAVAVAGVAVAQDAPVVTKTWAIEKVAIEGWNKNEFRFGTGSNGKVYTVNKAGKQLVSISPDGITAVDLSAYAPGVGITTDQAGNILINQSFPNAASGTDYIIVPADGSDIKPLTLTYPEGLTVGRIDQIGRIVGDLLSEEGAAWYLTPNGSKVVGIAYVQNGEQAELLDYMTTEEFAAPTVNTSSIAQPLAENITDFIDLGDEAVNAFCIRNRSTKSVYNMSAGVGDPQIYPSPAGANTQEGFDVFTLGGVTYQVVPTKKAANYESHFAIADTEGNIIYESDYEFAGDGGQSFGGFTAHKVSDTKVELYQWFSSAAGAVAAMYTIEIPGGEQPIAPLYAAGSFQGWSPENAVEFTYADGVYTLELTDAAEFKISTSKGSWDEFDAGVIGIADEPTAVTKFNTPIAITAGLRGNTSVVADGAFTVKVDLNAMTLEIVGKGRTYTYFAEDFEWLEPWSSQKPAGQTIESNDVKATAQQLGTNKVDGVSTYDALLAKGYDFVISNSPDKEARAASAQTYLQRNYLKMGLTGYYSGIVLPALKNVPVGANINLSFDASSMRQGDGKWDETKLVVIVANGDDVKKYPVELPHPADGEAFQWYPISVALDGAVVTKDTKITIRNADEQWPTETATTFRWFIDNISLTGDAEPLPVMPDLYLRGEFNEWGTTTPMTLTDEPVECIGAIYRLHLDELEAGEFKIANEDWSINRGADADPVVVLGAEMNAWVGGQNFKVEKKLVNVDITLFYKHDVSVNSMLKVEGTVWEAPKHRAALAYGLAISPNADDPDQFAVSFNATDEGKAVVVLTNQENPEDVVRIDLGEVVKGANTIPFSTAELPNGSKYNWAVEIISNIEGEAPVLVHNEVVTSTNSTGGVVTITDEAVASYGYTVVGLGRGEGFMVYDPEGKLVGKYHEGYEAFDASNTSSPTRGSEREGLAVFADWSDKGAGYWVIDPLNPTNEPYNLLAAPGATRVSSGLYTTAEGVITAGGTPAVAFQGKGDETVMYGFEEDRPDAANVIVAWPIGSAQYLTVAPKMIYSGKAPAEGSSIPTNEGGVNTNSRLLNTNVDIVPVENGFFASQVRASGNQSGTPPFIYVSNDGQEIMNAGLEEIMESASSGIAITKDRSIFAASQYDGIRLFNVVWDETGFPVMTKLADIDVPGLRWAHMRFDAANNLHVFARSIGYQVYALNGEGTATTAAPAELAIAISRPEPKHRAAMAYDLSIVDNGSDNYSVTFKSSDEGQAAIVLTNQADAEDVATIDLGAVVKGENTLAFSAGDLKGGTYNWAIEIISNIEGEAPVLVYAGETPEQVVRGGVVTITDETVPAYGYTIVSHGKWQGFDVYDPAGEHVGTFHKGFKQSTNQSAPFRGAEREGLAVFADWSDGTAGYWVVDPLNPTAEPYNLLAAPGATVAGSGLYTTAEGVITAGGSAAIAFQGKGDDTVMYGFEEDRPDASNVVVAWPIGSAQYLTVAPKMIFSGAAPAEGSSIPTNEGGVNTKSRLANTNVDILPVENGVFLSQVRGEGNNTASVPGFIYMSNDGQEIMNSGLEELMTSCTAGIAITKDRSLFAVSVNGGIQFFTIEWDETGFPAMTKLTEVEVPGLGWAQMRFDAANNLHVYARECGGYQVYALNGEGTASTAAPVELAITKQGDGISDIAVDAANGDAVYYNLNGVRIAAENLTPGVYVKVVNGKASKVVVK